MTLPKALPQEVGIDPERLKLAQKLLERGLEQELYPGAVYLIGRRGKIAAHGWLGHLDPERTMPMVGDALFDMASVTKPAATGMSALILLQRGELHLGELVTSFFPERSLPHLSDVCLRHLITHTSGIPAWRDMYSKEKTREDTLDTLFSTPLNHNPGTTYVYSCLGYIMLGLVLEKVAGVGLDKFAKANVYEPLGMADTGYTPGKKLYSRIARTAHCPARKRTLVGEVHDGNAWAMGGVSGNAGLFSTAEDMARLCDTLLGDYKEGRCKLFAPLVARQAFENLLSPEIGGQSLGWFMYPNDMIPSGDLLSRRSIGHSGFTGTSVVIDPDQDLFVILLTNRVCRDDDGAAFRKCRRLFHNAVAQSIVN